GVVLGHVPFVRFVGLNGSMMTGSMRKESDIDLFIAAEPGRVMITRVMTTILVALTGLRVRSQKTAGLFCLNRYASSHFLEITPRNLYHARVFHNMYPIYAPKGVYERYLQENDWMAEFGHHVKKHKVIMRWSPFIFIKIMFEWLFWPFADLL